jgi:hypothetical protein
MTLDTPTALIAAAFASQILVCSFLTAWRFSRAWALVRQKYPPAEYPRLYPFAYEQLFLQFSILRGLRIAIGVGATAALAFGLLQGITTRRLSEFMMWALGAQLLPSLIYLPMYFRMMRAIRAMPVPAVRSAELRQWRLADFVAPAWVVSGITASIVALATTAYLYNDNPHRNPGALAFGLLVNGWLLLRMLYVVLRPPAMRRPDPYMSDDDVFRARRMRLRMLFVMAAFLGPYFAFMQIWGAGKLHIDRIYVDVGVSILCQLMSWRMSHRVLKELSRTRDLSRYRAEAAQTA